MARINIYFTAFQDHFTHFKPSQLLGEAKPGDYIQAEIDLPHM